MNGHGTSGGFALITGLLFLIVLTILGVSSMSTVGLQERMASNLKEKARASETAEVANRGAETFLSEFPPPGITDEIPFPSNTLPPAGMSSVDGFVWLLDGPIAAVTPVTIGTFAGDAVWADAIVFDAPPFDTAALIDADGGAANTYAARPQSFTEEALFQPYTLNPEDLATGAGQFFYRVTGRGVGGNVTAVSVVQSMFTRRYR